MRDQLRSVRDQPISRSHARLAFVLSAAVIVLAAVALIALADAPRRAHQHDSRGRSPVTGWVVPSPPSTVATPPAAGSEAIRPRQDPQDQRGGRAARRARRALATHRALQHVPYRRAGVRVELTGAHDGKAILTVTAPSRRLARAGWHRFLARFHDRGSAYELHVKVGDGGRRGR